MYLQSKPASTTWVVGLGHIVSSAFLLAFVVGLFGIDYLCEVVTQLHRNGGHST